MQTDTQTERDELAAKLAYLSVAVKRLIGSTEVNGQKYSLAPSCGAWSDIGIALDYCEGKIRLFPDGKWEAAQ